ncbi:MAG TPA: NADH-quinone oxidoreductase subunit N, partial [Polyangiaceae bacterium]
KLYLVGVASTALTLFGLSLVFGVSGTTSIQQLLEVPPSPLLIGGMILVLAGLGFKIGVVPFHMWVPDTYQGAPTPFVAFLSVAPKLAGFAALSSLFLLGFSGQYSTWLPILTGLSLLSMTAGNLLAIGQSNVKRLLGYSGIAHIGYMLMAFATGSADGAGMLLFYGGGYVVTNVGAFLVVEAMAAQGGDDSIESFKGLAQRTPWLALAMLLFLLSLAGIPFVIGFWAKLYVFVVAWRAGLLWLVAAGAVLAVLALFYYLRIARAMYMDPPAKTESVRVAFPLRVAILLCLAGVVGLGAYPKPLLEQAEASAKPFFSTTQIAARSGHVDSP